MKKTFKLSVVVGGKETPVFMDNEKPGVIATVEATYDLTAEQFKSPMFAYSLMQQQQDILEDVVSVEIEEVK